MLTVGLVVIGIYIERCALGKIGLSNTAPVATGVLQVHSTFARESAEKDKKTDTLAMTSESFLYVVVANTMNLSSRVLCIHLISPATERMTNIRLAKATVRRDRQRPQGKGLCPLPSHTTTTTTTVPPHDQLSYINARTHQHQHFSKTFPGHHMHT